MSISTIGAVATLLLFIAFACGPRAVSTAIWVWFWRLLVAACVVGLAVFPLAATLAVIDLAKGVGEPGQLWSIVGQNLLMMGLTAFVAAFERRRSRLIAARTALVRVLRVRSEQ